MSIAEKKALRISVEMAEGARKSVLEKSGLDFSVRIDSQPVEGYDFDMLGKKKVEVLGALGKVPQRILESIGTIVEDADYKQAFSEVSSVVFVPAEDAKGSSFDYDTSASLEGSELRISYAPLTSMHGGYERSIKNVF